MTYHSVRTALINSGKLLALVFGFALLFSLLVSQVLHVPMDHSLRFRWLMEFDLESAVNVLAVFMVANVFACGALVLAANFFFSGGRSALSIASYIGQIPRTPANCNC